jgi:hypothetical protein
MPTFQSVPSIADCGTTIQYNGILLRYVLSEGWSFETVFDSTGVDPIGVKTTINCTCELHTSDQTLHGANVNQQGGVGNGLGPGLKDVVDMLLVPRRSFKLWIGNEVVFDILPGEVEGCTFQTTATDDQKMDIALGPRCGVQVLNIAGMSSAKCRLRFEFTTPLKCSGDIGDILNLRYWMAEDVDCKTWMTSRKYVGRFRMKRHTTDAAKNPFMIARALTLPPIQRGFHRKSIGWSESQNGLEFDFTIIDQEVWAVAPSPATDWEGTYSLTVPPGAVCTEQELSFRLWTNKSNDPMFVGTEKSQLFQLAEQIIEKKLNWRKLNVMNSAENGSIYVLSSVWQEDLKEPQVSVSVRIRNTNPLTWLMNLHQQGGSFTLGHPLPPAVGIRLPPSPIPTILYDKSVSYQPAGPTSTVAGLCIAALQNPCCTDQLSDKPTPDVYRQPTTYVPSTESSYNLIDDKASNRYSVSHTGDTSNQGSYGMYHWYRMTSDYVGDPGWRAFPKGTQCLSDSSADTVAFAQIHCQVMLREVRIHACRTNAWPQIPKPVHWTDRNSIKHVLLKYKISPCPVTLSADGMDRACEVYATYLYVLSRPPRQSDDPNIAESILAGVLPLVNAETLGVGTNTTDFSAISPEYFKDPTLILDHGPIAPGSEMGA